MEKEHINYVDGKYCTAKNSVISCSDLSVLRGIGVFEYVRTFNGKLNHIKPYFERLKNSVNKISLKMPATVSEIKQILEKLLRKNYCGIDLAFRIMVLGGESSNHITLQGKPRLVVLVDKLMVPSEDAVKKGIKLITSKEKRIYPKSKTINYIPAILALNKAKAAGADDALYVTDDNHALECTTSNIFLVKNNKLITPDAGILVGRTRNIILKKLGLTLKKEVRPVRLNELYNADEVFISASTKGVLPVVKINSIKIKDGMPGKISQAISSKFDDYMAKVNL